MMQMRRGMLLGAGLLSMAMAMTSAQAQTVSYSQGDFVESQWDFSYVTQSSGPIGSRLLLPGFGNPANSWLHDWQLASVGGTSSYRVAQINNTFTYDPGVHGPLASLEFSYDVYGSLSQNIGTASAPFFGFFVPTLRQGGQVFFSAGVRAEPTKQAWTTFTATLTGSDPWVDPNNQTSTLRPDFSAAGGLIEFGYIFSVNTNCPGTVCSAATIQSVLDNFAVSAYAGTTPNPTVPEPATYALMAAGLAGLAVTRRRRRQAATR